MINMGRRGLLKLMGAAPAVAAMAPAVTVNAAGYGVAGIGAGTAMMGNPEVPASAPSMRSFTSFAKWMMEEGHQQLKQEAKYVVMIDPDLAVMHLPLQTKVNMQRERNYKDRLERQKNWFERTLLRDGKVQIW